MWLSHIFAHLWEWRARPIAFHHRWKASKGLKTKTRPASPRQETPSGENLKCNWSVFVQMQWKGFSCIVSAGDFICFFKSPAFLLLNVPVAEPHAGLPLDWLLTFDSIWWLNYHGGGVVECQLILADFFFACFVWKDRRVRHCTELAHNTEEKEV